MRITNATKETALTSAAAYASGIMLSSEVNILIIDKKQLAESRLFVLNKIEELKSQSKSKIVFTRNTKNIIEIENGCRIVFQTTTQVRGMSYGILILPDTLKDSDSLKDIYPSIASSKQALVIFYSEK